MNQPSRSSVGASSFSRVSFPLAVVLIGANLRAPITSLGPVLSDIQHDLHLQDAGAGLLNALPLLVFAALSLVAPQIGRRHGLERVMVIAVAAIFLGTVLRSLDLPWSIWIGTLLLSAGIAFGNVLLPGLVKRDYPDRAGSVIGAYAAAMAGMAGLSAGLAAPIARIPHSSWRWSLGCWALLALVTLIVWLPRWKATEQPSLIVYATSRTPGLSPWKHIIGWQVSLFFAAHSLVFYALVDWYAAYAVSRGVSEYSTGVHLLVYQVVAVLTNLGSASLIKRLPHQMGLGFWCGVALMIGTGGLLFAPELSLLWMICAGLGAGIAMVTSLALFSLRTSDHHAATKLSGMAQFIGYLGAAAGPLLVGVLHQFSQRWALPLAFMLGSAIVVLVVATLAGRARVIE